MAMGDLPLVGIHRRHGNRHRDRKNRGNIRPSKIIFVENILALREYFAIIYI